MNIYWQGKIYENVEQGDSRYNYPAIEVIHPHSFTDGQEVLEGRDYEKKCQHKGIHNSTCIYHVAAIPLAQQVQADNPTTISCNLFCDRCGRVAQYGKKEGDSCDTFYKGECGFFCRGHIEDHSKGFNTIVVADNSQYGAKAALPCICMDCNKPYYYDLTVPDELWAVISPRKMDGWKTGGLLCPECIMDKTIKFYTDTIGRVGKDIIRQLEEAFKPQYMNDYFTWHTIQKALSNILNTDYGQPKTNPPKPVQTENWEEKFKALDELVTRFGILEVHGEETAEYERLYNIWKPNTFPDEK